jgi:hypothetical protein
MQTSCRRLQCDATSMHGSCCLLEGDHNSNQTVCCRFTFDVTGSKNVSGTDTDTKDAVTVMICNDGNGHILPMLISVAGKTHQALDKFVLADPDAWGAPGALKGKQRAKHLDRLVTELGCSKNTGVALHGTHHILC